MIGIYMFEHKITHEKYIGQSTNITKRKWEHLTYPSPCSKIDDALLKERDNFEFSILEECPADQLNEREIYWIEYYDTINTGYNLIKGGDCYRGENNVQAKLSNQQVLEIIHLLEECKLTNNEIAKLYNVHINTIDFINRCKIWCHLHHYTTNIRNENLKQKKPQLSVHCGELGTNKISEEQAKNIIELLKYDTRSIAQLSRDLDISLNILYDINRCRTWKYLHHYNKNIRQEAKKEVVPA